MATAFLLLYIAHTPGLKVPQVLLAARGTCLQVGVAMELSQLTWPQPTPTMKAIYILTDSSLDQTHLM